MYLNAHYKELAAFKTIPHFFAMVIVLFLLQPLVYIEYYNLIGFATTVAAAQVP